MTEVERIVQAEITALRGDICPLHPFVQRLHLHEVAGYWIVQIPVGILHAVCTVEAELSLAFEKANVAKLAHLSRNALELHIWAEYASSSMDAAKRFHQDAYVDVYEVFRLLGRIPMTIDPQWAPAVAAVTEQSIPALEHALARDHVDLSIEQIRTLKHLDIAQIAQQIGYGSVFSWQNRVLSKLVHATAMSTLLMDNCLEQWGPPLVGGIAWELRAAIKAVDVYLRANNLPRYLK